jgi:uncharacterized membrane protein
LGRGPERSAAAEFLFAIVIGLAWLALPFAALAVASRARRAAADQRERTERLERRIAGLERHLASMHATARAHGTATPIESRDVEPLEAPEGAGAGAPFEWTESPATMGDTPGTGARPATGDTSATGAAAAPGPGAAAAPAAGAAPAPGPIATPVESPATTAPRAAVTTPPGVAAPPATPPRAAGAPFPRPAPAPRPLDAGRLEDLVGGVWLQNVGAVLLLAGVFFLIVWGWTTGRFGPGVIVVSGVALGALLVWRGDRTRRTLPGLGHALIGTGFGVVYVTLYLGHFTLRVLPAPFAFAALVATSGLALLAGLQYRVQLIAALGVIGAFLPQLLAGLVPLRGFSLPAPTLLAYLGAVNALVFLLAARAGWSGLDLAALALSAATWIGAHPRGDWGWGTTIGLAVLFAALGLAPLPRLARTEGAVRPLDLAVIAVAPLALVAAAWPMLAHAHPRQVAMLLLALAALYAGAAAWVDARRAERDLWRPLTGAASLFAAAALQRALGPEHTPLAWTLEGMLLVALGLAPRAGWLRVCGTIVAIPGVLWTLGRIVERGSSWPAGSIPVFWSDGIRDGIVVAALLAIGVLLHRRRADLGAAERWTPEVWSAAGHLLLMCWIGRESAHLAWAFEGDGPWRRPPDLDHPRWDARRSALFVSVLGFGWFAQAAALAFAGVRARRAFPRFAAHVVGAVAAVTAWAGLTLARDGWSRDRLPILHADGLLALAAIAAAVAVAANLARGRDALLPGERRAPEAWTVLAVVLLLGWSAREADHVARALLGLPGAAARPDLAAPAGARARLSALAPVFTSVAWLAQALLSMALGWRLRSAFLRWVGLALVGVTAVKFLVHDLAGADPFWRFLTAVAVGAAMLALSWVYQRRRRAAERTGS